MMQRKYRKVLISHHLLGADQTQEGIGGEEARKVDIEESVCFDERHCLSRE